MHTVPDGTIMTYFDRASWLADRRTGIGGSDIGAILGLSSFTSPLEVYYDKVERVPEAEPSEEMDIGRDIEDWILKRWMRVQPQSTTAWTDLLTIRSNEYPFLLHSPDALLMVGHDIIGGVEIKNIRSDSGWDPLPERVMTQVQHGLLCSGLPFWDVVALVAGQRIIHRQVAPDREMMGRIALEADKFWSDHVLAKVPPDPDGSESAAGALRRRWGASEGGSVEIPASLWEEYQRVDELAKDRTAEKAEIGQKIQALMGPNERATVDDKTVATWKTGTRTTFDIKRFRHEHAALAEKFDRTSTTRIFRPQPNR